MTWTSAGLTSYLSITYLLTELFELLVHKVGSPKCVVSLEPRTIYFQFQVLHRTIMTNKKLQQFNLRNNDNCESCGAREDISHLLYECPLVYQIWISLENWLLRNITSMLYFDKNSIILGNTKNEPIVIAFINTNNKTWYL